MRLSLLPALIGVTTANPLLSSSTTSLRSVVPATGPGLIKSTVSDNINSNTEKQKEKLSLPFWPTHYRKGITRANYVQIFLGLADGFGLKLVDECVQDSLRFEEDVVTALKDFESKSEAGVKDG